MRGRRCAVLGSPIAHSLSPALHRAAYDVLGLDWRYDAFDVDEAALPGFLDALDSSWRGLSLTMPLKRAAIACCAWVSEPARLVGAVNTIVFDAERGRLGSNTDIPGMVAALRERGVMRAGSAIVLGVGATACSSVAAMADLGVDRVDVVARRPERAAEIVRVGEQVGASVTVHPWERSVDLEAADLLVSTVPADAAGAVAERLVDRVGVIFDAIYDPWPTTLADRSVDRGHTVVNGFDLLVHQAVLQVEAMTGVAQGPLARMRSAGESALAARTA